MKEKILFIVPHLSTGGFPQYLVWNVKEIYSTYDVYVIEYNLLSSHYVVQRNKIKDLLPQNFITLGDDKFELLNLINKINPNIIHWGDIPETFCDDNITRKIYSTQRNYVIIESSHGSTFNTNTKRFFPDKFILVCEWSKLQYQKFGIPIDIIEYPIIERIKNPNIDIGFNKNKKHVLNVGLFTPGKNQKEIFDIAKHMPDIDFHFVGNLADNFKFYWEPLINNKPDNCIIHGEREDVDNFYNCSDLFLFTSTLELNPISIKEALSWKLPILIRNLPTYCNSYSGPFLTDNIEENIKLIKNIL